MPYLDLVVAEQEDGRDALLPCPAHHLPEVLPPVQHPVVLSHLNLEELEVGHEGRESGCTLTSTAPYTCHIQGVYSTTRARFFKLLLGPVSLSYDWVLFH